MTLHVHVVAHQDDWMLFHGEEAARHLADPSRPALFIQISADHPLEITAKASKEAQLNDQPPLLGRKRVTSCHAQALTSARKNHRPRDLHKSS
jgi:hypothetical protein